MCASDLREWAPRWWQLVLMAAIALGVYERAVAQAPLPELSFVDPAGFYRSAIYPPADFSSTAVNASLQIYPFRVVDGDVREAFSRTLLRELIDARFQETNVAAGARLDAFPMAGADIVLRAHFNEAVAGQMHERLRMAVVVGTAVAIVDTTASSSSAWVQVMPQLEAFAATLKVVSGTAEPAFVAPPTAAGAALAGLYMGFTTKYEALFSRHVPALYYYLLSADGQVYRAYDGISVPGNDPARFDFAGARRADPVNSGQYTLDGDAITMRLGTRETVVAQRAPGNTLMIAGVSYERQ